MIVATNRHETRRKTQRDELSRRMARPQRHRLLQGYPMAPLMRPVSQGVDPLHGVELDTTRPLIVGVLPHTFCNPKVRGCGFCTFPHEKFANEPMRRLVERVAAEIGFGPGAISTFTDRDRRRAIKWMNAGTSEAFTRAMSEQKTAAATAFDYAATDLRLLHLTRNLARLFVDCARYETFFGTDPVSDFPAHFEALEDARLVRCEGQAVELTPEGMFYADAVAGLLSHERIAEIRGQGDDRIAAQHHMG